MKSKGFTLIELMIVIAIIGVLAATAVPQYGQYIQRSKLVEPLIMMIEFKQKVYDYYVQEQAFPVNNTQAGMPEPDQLIGNSMTGVYVESGAIHMHLGNKIGESLEGKVLTFRPAVVVGSPASPISWLCGFDEPIEGMRAIGENKTTVDMTVLPSSCRQR